MSDPNAAPDPNAATAPDPNADATKREEARATLQTWGEEVKQEIATKLDQKLDELGARIGGQ